MNNKTNYEIAKEICAEDKSLHWKGYPDEDRYYIGVAGDYEKGTTALFGSGYYRLRSHINYEAHYGIKVVPGDHIHHIDNNSLNDSPYNLQQLKGGSHMRLHKLINRHEKVLEFKRLSPKNQVATIRSWTVKPSGTNVSVRGSGVKLVGSEKDLDKFEGLE